MKGKQEQLDEMYTLQRKALKIMKKEKYDGEKVNKMLEAVIKKENLYMKRYGRNPSKEYGEIENEQAGSK